MDERANRVREARQALGWSQETLAKKAGCDVRTVRRVEAGERVSPSTMAEVMTALKMDRPPVSVEVKADAVVVELKPAAPTVVVENPAPEAPASEEPTMETQSITDSGGLPPTPQDETFGDWLKRAEKDPKVAEQAIQELTRTVPSPEETVEKLTMGFRVVDFLERFQDAQIYVLWDTEDPELRKTLAAFIASATGVQKALRHNGFDSAQRFEAQCYFADHLNAMHKLSWKVTGTVRRHYDMDGYCTVTGYITIDEETF